MPLSIATDPPHQTKRYRVQSNKGNFTFIKHDNFVEISKRYPEVLPPCVLQNAHQKQSVPIATRKFLLSVEEKAIELGFNEEAKFIQLLRNWIAVFDKRGLTLAQRLQYLADMDAFLLSLVDLNSISQASAPYVAGITRELFEETLVLNQTYRDVLNSLPVDKQIEFNSRSLSTDSAECLFSVLKHICPRPTVRLLLQAWRTTSREYRKQLDENRGYVCAVL